MPKTIIMFLSKASGNPSESDYLCPDGEYVKGVNTSDAPIRYFLKKHPDVTKILSIVTPEAKETGWTKLIDTVQEIRPGIHPVEITFSEGEDFTAGPLSEILKQLNEEDEILLETTGGLRDAVMYLLLLSRVLTYTGHPTVQALYSNFFAKPKRIEDVSHLIDMFDLVGGLQELTSLGRTESLQKYYSAMRNPDSAIKEVIDSMEALSEAITLCRVNWIDDRMKRFNDALEHAETCTDPLIRHLLPTFRKRYGKKLNTSGLIRWCIDSGMLQQALTVYTEKIPAFIKNRGDIMEFAPFHESEPWTSYEDKDAAQFMKHFLMLSEHPDERPTSGQDPQVQALRNYIQEHVKDIVKYAEGDAVPSLPPEIKTGVGNLVLIAKLAYLDHNNTFYSDWSNDLPKWKEHLKDLSPVLEAEPAKDVIRMINKVQSLPLSEFQCLLKDGAEKGMQRIQTIENLEQYLPYSGYKLKFPLEQVQTIARDYLYIKALRNMTNHANSEETVDQEILMKYLKGHGYISLEEVTANKLKAILTDCLHHLQLSKKKKK